MVSRHERELARDIRSAESGDIESQYFLAFRFENGTDKFPQDDTQAVHWYRLCAERNAPDCQFRLGRLYQEGRGVPQSYFEAAKWYQRAVQQDVRAAQVALGNLYRHGLGLPRDYGKSAKLYLEAAEHNWHEAEFWLGWLYERGLGLDQDDAQAACWYQRAADGMEYRAMAPLSLMYRDGRGLEKNESLARYWLDRAEWFCRSAATSGIAAGEHALGQLYEFGIGLPQDLAEALYWYRKAASKRYVDALADLMRLGEEGEF